MSLDTPKFLAELYSNIRARPIAWEAAVRAHLISDTDVKRIKAVDKVSKERRVGVLDKDGEAYAQLVLGTDGVLNQSVSGKRMDIVQYMLVLTADLLQDVPKFADSLLALPSPNTLLLSLLKADDPIPLLSSSILSTLLATALGLSSDKPKGDAEAALPEFYNYLSTLAKSPDHHLQDLAIQSYVSLLRTSFARNALWAKKEETLDPIVKILETAAAGSGSGGDRGSMMNASTIGNSGIVQGGVPLQLLYHILLVIWELTFESDIAAEINEKYDLIPPLTEILRSSLKEKITRVSLATLANLAIKAPSANLPGLLISNVLPHLQTLSTRFNAESDPDLTADLSTLIAALEAFQSEQTTLSSYRLEVMSGHLRWSPPHRNEGFWKKHAREIYEDKELVRALARVLGSSQDKVVLQVAANDVGVLIREVPYSRKKWEELGVKNRVMELMGDTDAEVRYEALKAVQGFLQNAFSG